MSHAARRCLLPAPLAAPGPGGASLGTEGAPALHFCLLRLILHHAAVVLHSPTPFLSRFALGHFDGPADDNPFRRIPPSVVGSREHLALAREAAAKSIVLLKNEPQAAGADAGQELAAAAAAAGAAGATGCGGSSVHEAAAPLLPLKLDRLRRLTVLGPFANRSGEAGRCLMLQCASALGVFARAAIKAMLLTARYLCLRCSIACLQNTCLAAIMALLPAAS